jgi:hypothetical protein
MKLATALLIFLSGCFLNSNSSKVVVVASTALVMEQLVEIKRFTEEHLRQLIADRKEEYTKALEMIKTFGYTPYAVEPCFDGPTYLNELTPFVCYTKTNNIRLNNKGVNEAVSLKAALEKWSFNDNDVVVKITGRYCFEDDFFLKFAEQHKDADVIVKEFTDSAFTGGFAMKYKHLMAFLEWLDLKEMEEKLISIEQMLARYLKAHEKKLTILKLEKINMKGRVFNDGVNIQYHNW